MSESVFMVRKWRRWHPDAFRKRQNGKNFSKKGEFSSPIKENYCYVVLAEFILFKNDSKIANLFQWLKFDQQSWQIVENNGEKEEKPANFPKKMH